MIIYGAHERLDADVDALLVVCSMVSEIPGSYDRNPKSPAQTYLLLSPSSLELGNVHQKDWETRRVCFVSYCTIYLVIHVQMTCVSIIQRKLDVTAFDLLKLKSGHAFAVEMFIG